MTLDQVRAMVGQALPPSAWVDMTQADVTAFANLTGDFADIHTDPGSRAARDFGGTVAQGFFSLSLLTSMVYQVLPDITGHTGLNYGFDRIRFVAPVPAGSRLRGHLTLVDLTEVSEGQQQLTWGVTIELENAEKPAVVAKWLTRYIETKNA